MNIRGALLKDSQSLYLDSHGLMSYALVRKSIFPAGVLGL